MLRCCPSRGHDMETSGGTFYHDNGFAGLPPERAPVTTTLLGEHRDLTPNGERKITNVTHQSVVLGPDSVAGALLLK